MVKGKVFNIFATVEVFTILFVQELDCLRSKDFTLSY